MSGRSGSHRKYQSKIGKKRGFNAQVKFDEGLSSSYVWAEESAPDVSGYERSLDEMRWRGLLHGS